MKALSHQLMDLVDGIERVSDTPDSRVRPLNAGEPQNSSLEWSQERQSGQPRRLADPLPSDVSDPEDAGQADWEERAFLR